MTLEYIGVINKSDAKAQNLLLVDVPATKRGTARVEAVKVISSDIHIPLSKSRIREISKWDFTL